MHIYPQTISAASAEARPANPLIGLAIKLPDNCGSCGSNIAVISAGDEKHYAWLTCRNCGQRRNPLQASTAKWIESVAGKFGAPEIITIRALSIARACAKQDEFLKRKFSPTGKSWFDIITESFDEIVPAPSGTGEDNDFPLVPKETNK